MSLGAPPASPIDVCVGPRDREAGRRDDGGDDGVDDDDGGGDGSGDGYVALHNDQVLLLHLLLLFRVHFDLARDLWTRKKYNLEISLGGKITLLGESITQAPIPHMLFGNFTM